MIIHTETKSANQGTVQIVASEATNSPAECDRSFCQTKGASMASLNKVCIIGRLGHAPQVQYSNEGTAVCHLSIATDESYTSKDGQNVSRTEWHRVNVFGRQAENCGVYLKKGSLVYVEGSLGTRKWQDKDGSERYSTEIAARVVTFLDSRQDDNVRRQMKDETTGGGFGLAAGQQQDGGGSSVMDDFPF